MKIKIEVERIKKYKINGIDALPLNDLPIEYKQGNPCIYKNIIGDGFTLKYHDYNNDTYHHMCVNLNMEFTEPELRVLINKISLAGERLSRINHLAKNKNANNKLKEEKKQIEDWSGTYTIEV